MHTVYAYVRGVWGFPMLQAVAWQTRSRANEGLFETKEGNYFITEFFVMQCTIIINSRFKHTYQKTVKLQNIVLYFFCIYFFKKIMCLMQL
jgi:hypothetical protein